MESNMRILTYLMKLSEMNATAFVFQWFARMWCESIFFPSIQMAFSRQYLANATRTPPVEMPPIYSSQEWVHSWHHASNVTGLIHYTTPRYHLSWLRNSPCLGMANFGVMMELISDEVSEADTRIIIGLRTPTAMWRTPISTIQSSSTASNEAQNARLFFPHHIELHSQNALRISLPMPVGVF